MTDAARLKPFAFVVAVPDLDSVAAYFRDVLGFTSKWGDGSDGHRLMFGRTLAR
jgi:hypothetical protein